MLPLLLSTQGPRFSILLQAQRPPPRCPHLRSVLALLLSPPHPHFRFIRLNRMQALPRFHLRSSVQPHHPPHMRFQTYRWRRQKRKRPMRVLQPMQLLGLPGMAAAAAADPGNVRSAVCDSQWNCSSYSQNRERQSAFCVVPLRMFLYPHETRVHSR